MSMPICLSQQHFQGPTAVSVSVSVSDEVFRRIPGLRLAIVAARNVTAVPDRQLAISAHWHTAWQKVFAAGVPHAEQPHIRAYRRALKSAGVKIQDYPPAVESIYRRACKTPIPFSVGPIVDFYNACTLRHAMPVAGFDIDHLDAPLRLSMFGGGEAFFGIGRETSEPVQKGEIGYQCAHVPLSRHFMWRQARNAALSESTSNLLLITEAVPGVTDEAIDAMTGSLLEGIRRWFGATAGVTHLDENHSHALV
jgi:DNA/RNA-binding domain of Phe-tRNA-synthetase-like protein